MRERPRNLPKTRTTPLFQIRARRICGTGRGPRASRRRDDLRLVQVRDDGGMGEKSVLHVESMQGRGRVLCRKIPKRARVGSRSPQRLFEPIPPASEIRLHDL